MYAIKDSTCQQIHIFTYGVHSHAIEVDVPGSSTALTSVKGYINMHIQAGMIAPLQLMQQLPEGLQNSVTQVQLLNYIQHVKKKTNEERHTPFQMIVHDLKNSS